MKISREAKVDAELLLVDGDDPNAFAALNRQRQPVLAVNLGMIKLIGDDADEFAALLGHEAGHLGKGHFQTGQTRTKTIEAIGSLLGAGLGMAGIPAGGVIADFGVQLVESSFSRAQEREADAAGLEYMMAAGFNPEGAIRIHEKMLQVSKGSVLPFLSSHPSNAERIENLKALIEKTPKPVIPQEGQLRQGWQ